MEAELVRHPAGEIGEAAGDQGAMRAMRPHGGDQRLGAGVIAVASQVRSSPRWASRPPSMPTRSISAWRMPLASSSGGDLGDLRLEPGIGGDFVQRLAGDDGAVHIGQQQPLARPSAGLAMASTGASPRAARAAATACSGARPLNGMSAASSGASQSGVPALAPSVARAAPGSGPGSRRRGRRWAPRGSGSGTCGADHAAGRGMTQRPLALIIAGPTASGKSALALAIARRCGGTVINADAMQVYRELRVLTARPTPQEEAPGAAPSCTACGRRRPAGQRRLVAGGGVGEKMASDAFHCRSCAGGPASISCR